jgi:hypothetical protein
MTTSTALHFLVSCDHVAPSWRRENTPATVKIDRQGEGKADRYYVSLTGFGCSRSYATPYDAIVGMLQEHGCYDIQAEPQDTDTVLALEHESTVADVKRHREERAIRYVLVVGNYVYAAYGDRRRALKAARVIASEWHDAQRVLTLVDTWGIHPLFRITVTPVKTFPIETLDAMINDANLVATVMDPTPALETAEVDLSDHPFSDENIAYESGADDTSDVAWFAFCAAVERELGIEDLDGNQVTDGYSLDHAHDCWMAGDSPAETAAIFRDCAFEILRRRAWSDARAVATAYRRAPDSTGRP